MRRVINYLSIFIILCFLADSAINYSIARQLEDQSPYYLSFASIGANLLESRLDCWAKINTTRTFAEMDEELSRILITLNLPVKSENFRHQEQNGTKLLYYELFHNNQSYMFTLQTESQNTYFLLSSTSSQNDQRLRAEEKILKNALHCKSYFQYQGIINARLDKAGREKLLNVMAKSLTAQKIGQYESDNLTSMTGLSPKLDFLVESENLAGTRLLN